MTEDISGEYAEAWRRFQETDSLRLLQETLEWEWTRGRQDYVAFLIGIGEPEVRDHIASVIRELDGIPGVDPYPERYWHITVKGLGFLTDDGARPDELSREEAQRIAEAARPVIEAQAPFEVRVGRVNAFPEVVFLEALDGGVVRRLNSALLDVPGVAAQPVDGVLFLPHISIARFQSNEGLGELKARLARLRELSAGPSFVVREVLLVQAHLAAEAPTFELLALYELGGAAGSQ